MAVLGTQERYAAQTLPAASIRRSELEYAMNKVECKVPVLAQASRGLPARAL
jgi:hypothetical protein